MRYPDKTHRSIRPTTAEDHRRFLAATRVQMGRYLEVETDHEGLVPVRAGCGVSGRHEREARAGSASGRREWTARAGGASGRRSRVARSDGVRMGRYWEISAPGHLGAAGWLGDCPEAMPWCLGRSYGGSGGHLVIWMAILPRYPRWGALRTRGRRKRARLAKRAEAGGPTPSLLCSARRCP